MRVLIVTAGSWGDVAPYTGLGTRLRSAGHEVTIATHSRFDDAVTARGLGFRPLPLDPREELASAAGQGLARAVSAPVAMARLVGMARQFIPRLTEGVVAAVRQGADVLLSSTLTDPMCSALGEATGLPAIGVYLQPIEPTGAFPPLVTGARSFGPYGNRLAARAMRTATDRVFAPAVSELRRELGLPAPRFGGPLGLPHGRTVLHGFSPTVVRRPADWPEAHEVCGYWWPATRPDWRPEPRLLDFLDAGPPPVFVGFGSFVTADAERLSALVSEALRRAKVRGIVQAGWSGLHAEGDELLTVQEVPHAWLFPRTAAVVHHAGAGTTAAGLRAGVPAVPVPVQLDQHFWAARLHSLGVSGPPIRYQRLTATRLAAAVSAATRTPALATRARQLAAALSREDGAARVLTALERLS
ncbi:glycosyltransferase family 1 protein [Streptomyces sp. ISL-66]|uniref:glycosyltransferase n=1 Tax=Streptomyces sp. ISL-66 TaxID=2819186 RepID=UPI001BEAC38D|nr:glycosyltransferase [Streptomyces sp. ISL-66]MBT2470003.1 glycosyltransferase family 1 protein [Streptomyces sp. ISL-66]